MPHLAAFAAACAQVRPAPERILELGTGTGEAALFLAREFPGASVRGVDLSEEMIHAAQAKVGSTPRAESFESPTRPTRSGGDESSTRSRCRTCRRSSRSGGSCGPKEVIVAASWGAATPFYTPPAVLERGLRRHGITSVADGETGGGSVVRRPQAPRLHLGWDA